mmetsp:Transcript_50520/g.81639  ORF Transcript_50520/g.81639 Transcript_50520/m.81639 type:complete len:86 (+) Transcript_50520:268-525(+)
MYRFNSTQITDKQLPPLALSLHVALLIVSHSIYRVVTAQGSMLSALVCVEGERDARREDDSNPPRIRQQKGAAHVPHLRLAAAQS